MTESGSSPVCAVVLVTHWSGRRGLLVLSTSLKEIAVTGPTPYPPPQEEPTYHEQDLNDPQFNGQPTVIDVGDAANGANSTASDPDPSGDNDPQGDPTLQ